jgi:Secretion system C-terminal sorting domain/Fibronectin type III domain
MKFYNSVMKIQMHWLFTSFVLLSAHFATAQNCSYSLKLMDLGRNGWGTAGMLVQITGQRDSIYRHVVGDSSRVALSVRQGDSIRLTYVRSTDLSDGQNRFVLYDVNGDTAKVGQGTLVGSGNPFTFAEIASCASCRRTNNVEVRRVSATYIQLHWDIVAADASSYAVEYGPVGFRPGTGTVKSALDTLFYLTGLREFTEYDVYVSSVCGGNKGAYGQPTTFKTYYATDVAVVDLVNPWSRCMMGVDTVKIMIKNFGGTPQTLIQFRYSINGVPGAVNPPQDGMYTGVISKDSVAVVKFKIPYDFSVPGDYDFKAWVEVRGDSLTPNDTFRTVITSVPTITNLPYVSGFEPNRGGWTVGRESKFSSWEHGKPADMNGNIVSAASGEKAWTTNLIGNYNNNEKSYLYSPCLDFSLALVDPEISFSLNHNVEATYDGMLLEGTKDNGATWTTIGRRGNGVNWYNDTVRALGSMGWTRNSNGWVIAKDTLRGFKGNANCRLRFVFGSDLSVNTYDGIGIDNVVIRLPITTDLAAANATNKDKTICGSPNDSLTIKITNLSNVRQYRYVANYRVNGGAVVTENIDSLNIIPGGSVLYTFRTAFNSTTDGNYKIESWVKLVNDPAAYNDTTTLVFNRAAATSLPTVHNFNNYQLPANWNLSRAASGVERGGHGNRGTNGYVYANMYTGTGRNFTLTSGKLGLVRPLDSMSYDYRVVNNSGTFAGYNMATNDTIFVEAASCGGAWVGLDTVHAGKHVVDTLYKKRQLSLRNVSGGNIQIRFRIKSATSDFNGYFVDLDNINFFGCQPLAIIGTVTDSRVFASNDGRIAVAGTNGLPPYTYTWSYFNNPSALTGNDIRNLPPGTYTVRVTDARGCFDDKTFTVSFGNKVFEVGSAIAKVQLAPNPTTGVTFLNVSYNKAVDAKVQVYRITGQLVYETESRQSQEASYELDLGNFAAGMYLVRITAENKTHVERLMKQ